MSTEQEREQIVRDYCGTFGTEEGKRVVVDLAIFCGESRSSYKKDSHDTAFQEGARSVILYIRERLATRLDQPRPEIAKDE